MVPIRGTRSQPLTPGECFNCSSLGSHTYAARGDECRVHGIRHRSNALPVKAPSELHRNLHARLVTAYARGLCVQQVRRPLSVSASASSSAQTAHQHAPRPPRRRVVVTGTGVVSPLGHEVHSLALACIQETSCCGLASSRHSKIRPQQWKHPGMAKSGRLA